MMESGMEPLTVEYGKCRKIFNRIYREVWSYRFYRWLPRLVWIGDELDISITFLENKLPCGLTNENIDPIGLLNSGAIYEIEKRLNELGIEFDKGLGFGGRDWEWDWSLSGPVHIKFQGRARRPEHRK